GRETRGDPPRRVPAGGESSKFPLTPYGAFVIHAGMSLTVVLRTTVESSAIGRLARAILAGLLVSVVTCGCSVSPEQREATTRAWAERDAERASECRAKRGGWIAGSCVYGGGP